CRAWLIDKRAFARKVKNPSLRSAIEIKDSEATRKCPKCHHLIDNSDVLDVWPGLPAGVKFDPSDVEILEHLASKCGSGGLKPHMFIDEFIPTLEGDAGICYTHPENLPGAKKDGSSVHFFHRTTNAYATGQRKRRKIQSKEHVRWHKTGKTKAIVDNGVQKGYKKIMVLYKGSKTGSKAAKSNWVMHQYHLGADEEEKDGEYVVSKISYQQDKTDNVDIPRESDMKMLNTSPRTPKSTTPNPPRRAKLVMLGHTSAENMTPSPAQESEFMPEPFCPPHSAAPIKDNGECSSWWAGESQPVDQPGLNGIDDQLLCKETFDCYASINSGLQEIPYPGFPHATSDAFCGNQTSPCGVSDLDNIELDTPPDFQLADLQFCSQDSITSWLDRL
ncbi:NAC domain, partial [Dillenia turbinata]